MCTLFREQWLINIVTDSFWRAEGGWCMAPSCSRWNSCSKSASSNAAHSASEHFSANSRATHRRIAGAGLFSGSSRISKVCVHLTSSSPNNYSSHYFHSAIIWAIDAVQRPPHTQEWCSTAARWSPRSCRSSPSSPRSCRPTCARGQSAYWSRSTRPSSTLSSAAATAAQLRTRCSRTTSFRKPTFLLFLEVCTPTCRSRGVGIKCTDI